MELICPKCPRTFQTQGALNGHQRSHSFFTFLGKSMPKEFREQEQEEARSRVMLAAIHHFTRMGDASHCDVCEVVSETVGKPLMRDLVAYFESEGVFKPHDPQSPNLRTRQRSCDPLQQETTREGK